MSVDKDNKFNFFNMYVNTDSKFITQKFKFE